MKEQLRKIPQKGIGYGILRYLAGHSELSSEAEPEVLFNYLGQIDRMVQDSQLLSLAPESSGPWHSPLQRRRHALEMNSLVIDGRLEVWWTYSERLHKAETIENLGQSFVSALRSLIAHCQSPNAGGYTPSDFPLSGLDQETLDRFLDNTRRIQDLYPLSPMQMLFFTLGSVQPATILDQWHGTLQGDLDVTAFQRSWELVLERHAVLRSTFHEGALPEPLQMVHQQVALPWKVEDWSQLSAIQQAEKFAAFLKTDREDGFRLDTPPLARLALIRLSDDTFKFVWSVSALLLDGWSWPLVFRDLSRIYESLQGQRHPELEPPRLYREFEMAGGAESGRRQSLLGEHAQGFREPTRLPAPTQENWNGTERFGRAVAILTGLTGQLQSAARNLHVTLNTFVQSVWSLLLNRQSGSADVVFGATFSGRPADLDGSEEIVGPFANSLPIRVAVTAGVSLSEFSRQLHKQLLELSEFQYSSLLQVQGWSEVPWRERLFESLVVFQNYRVHESARQMGGSVVIGDFEGPIHTNYPMTLLAEPEPDLRITLIYDRSRFSNSLALRWARDLGLLLNRLPALLHEPIETALALLSIPVASVSRPATASQDYAPPQTEMERVISRIWQEVFHLEQVSVEDNFFELGADSLLMVRLHARLCEELKLQMPIVRLFEHPSIRALARHISQPLGHSVESSEMHNRAQRQKEALSRFRRPARRLSQMNEPRVEGIAIIGATGRFPGAGSVEEFWANLSAGRETISVFTDKELTASGLDVETLKRAGNYVPARGVLKDSDCFDAGFFGIHPNEAEVMDPQQRLFLEGCWEALERAGYVPGQITGSVGVYAGATFNTYYLHALHPRRDLIELMGREQVMLGNEKDYLATRVAYRLNLKGPAISLNTACSSSLVAVCQACQALLTYQCDMALAGGVSVRVPQNSGYYYQEGNIGSPDGHTRTFDEQARGTVFSNGIGIVVLKRLDEALEAGDQIYAVIKSAALNNDGSQRVSFGAPGVEGQSQVIALAHALAGVDPETIRYVEAHGTATPLGDPIEVAALTKAFRLSTQRKQFCAIGSVKSNIGHLDAAAGVAGLIKTALALHHRILPASLHFTRPNPKLELHDTPFFVCATAQPWETEDVPLRAGVSSFGTGGTNAHVVLEEAPSLPPPGPSCPFQVLPLSAKTSAALEAATTNLGECFKGQPGMNLADAAFTLQVGRSHFAHRRFAVCRNPEDAVLALDSLDPKRVFTGQPRLQDPPVIFMFPGQGAQYVSMGAELYHTESVFREIVDHCSERLEPILGLDFGFRVSGSWRGKCSTGAVDSDPRDSACAVCHGIRFG